MDKGLQRFLSERLFQCTHRVCRCNEMARHLKIRRRGMRVPKSLLKVKQVHWWAPWPSCLVPPHFNSHMKWLETHQGFNWPVPTGIPRELSVSVCLCLSQTHTKHKHTHTHTHTTKQAGNPDPDCISCEPFRGHSFTQGHSSRFTRPLGTLEHTNRHPKVPAGPWGPNPTILRASSCHPPHQRMLSFSTQSWSSIGSQVF